MPLSGRNLGDAINAALDAVPAPADTLPATLAAFRQAYYRALGIEIVDGCAGDFVTAVSSLLSPYAPITTDQVLACDTTGGAITITLPAAGGIFWITLVAGAWPVTVTGLGVVSHVGETLTVVYADGAWRILQRTLAGADANNADTLDGLHAMAFAGAAHVHDASEVTTGTLPLARGGTGRTTAPAGQIVYGNATGTAQTSDALLVRDSANDWVGIGTASPSRGIHVKKDTNSGTTGVLPTVSVENTHTPTGGGGDYSFAAYEMAARLIGGSLMKGQFFADGSGFIYGLPGQIFRTDTAHPIIFGVNYAGLTSAGHAICILSDRRVGIQTLAPAAIFQVGAKGHALMATVALARSAVHGATTQSQTYEGLHRLVRNDSAGYYPASAETGVRAYGASTGGPSFLPLTEWVLRAKRGTGYNYDPDTDLLSVCDDGIATLIPTTSRLGIGMAVRAATARLHLPAGSATAGTAPEKLTSGPLLAAPEAGAVEFLTDAFYGTVTTGPERREFATVEHHREQIVTVLAAASPYTVMASDVTILCDCTAGAITVNLPAVASSAKRVIRVKKIDATASAVTIQCSGAELCDGANTQSLAAQWATLSLHCDGAAWYLV